MRKFLAVILVCFAIFSGAQIFAEEIPFFDDQDYYQVDLAVGDLGDLGNFFCPMPVKDMPVITDGYSFSLHDIEVFKSEVVFKDASLVIQFEKGFYLNVFLPIDEEDQGFTYQKELRGPTFEIGNYGVILLCPNEKQFHNPKVKISKGAILLLDKKGNLIKPKTIVIMEKIGANNFSRDYFSFSGIGFTIFRSLGEYTKNTAGKNIERSLSLVV